MAAETIPFRSTYPKPEGLEAAGKKAWELGKSYWESGLINAKNIALWRMYCQQFDRIAKANKALKKDGDYQQTAQGIFVVHPATAQRAKAEKTIVDLAKLLGIVAAGKNDSGIEKVIARKRT